GPSRSQIRQLRELNPVLIHAHFGPDGIHAMPVAEKLGVPLVVTFHGYDVTMSDQALAAQSMTLRLYVRRQARLQQGAELFLCVSNFIRKKLLAKGSPAEKMLVHYIGVDTDFFQTDSSTERKKIVLFVSRLVENKGGDFLLRAMNAV